jgi:F0F1-type ATP synthase assembly protein I
MSSFFGMAGSGVPTIGTLEHHILIDQRMAQWQKQQLLSKLNSEVGHLPKTTPLSSVIGSLGGGIVGWLVAKYFSMGPVGQVISTAAGFGLGKQLQGVYGALGELASGSAGRSSMVRPFF